MQTHAAAQASAPKIGSISVLATASLVLSCASVLGCLTAGLVGMFVTPTALVAVLVLPAPALLGVVAAACALRSIRRSGGAIGGRTMAIIGLFVGLISGILQGAVAGAALATYWPVKQVVAPVVGEFGRELQRADYAAARMRLSPAASQVVTDERLGALLAPSIARYGPFQEANFGVDVFVDSFQRVREAAARGQASGASMGAGPGVAPKPVGLKFARGRVIAYVFIDQAALERGQVQLLDMLVAPPADPPTTLLPDGPAAQAAQALGMTPPQAAP